MLTIDNKFNIGDKIWFNYNGKFYQAKIKCIYSWDIPTGVCYEIESGHTIINNAHILERDMYKSLDDITVGLVNYHIDCTPPTEEPETDFGSEDTGSEE